MPKYSIFSKFATFFIPIAILTTACSTPIAKEFTITGSNKRERLLELSFDYSSRQTPEIKTEQPHNLALAQCKQWGYTDVNQSEPLTESCVDLQNTKCLRKRAVIKFQCQ